MTRKTFDIRLPVLEALGAGRAVVALESTIIAHGMPYPQNVETALEVERIVEEAGAVPATLAVLSGRITVGLTPEEIERLATGGNVMKAGERELPLAAATKRDAATTAGASIAIAAAAGIDVFVTGGIGSVGPDAHRDFDISADLAALAEYPVITVCAGAKAFMDIAGTLEVLETLRVPVATWRTDEFPLFYSRGSGHRSSWRVESADEVAAFFDAKRELGQVGGLLVGVPVPAQDELPLEELLSVVETAKKKWREAGSRGNRMTPFILSTIQSETQGRSLRANIALIRNNARIGAEIAQALRLRE
jgi:pseudouridine-5'-phosphate glycosidase